MARPIARRAAECGVLLPRRGDATRRPAHDQRTATGRRTRLRRGRGASRTRPGTWSRSRRRRRHRECSSTTSRSTSWTGTIELAIRLYVIGDGSSVSIDDVRLQSVSTVRSAFEDDFDTALDPGWTRSAALTTAVENGHLDLTVPNATGTWYGYLTRTITVDIDKYPILKVKVDSVGKYWAVKVNNGQGAGDTIVQNNTVQLGIFSFDLSKITGWSGTQRLSIKLFVFAVSTEPAGTSAARAAKALGADQAQVIAAGRRRFDELLASAPHPVDFGLQGVAADGVDARRIRAMYYRAWVFLTCSVLPPQPEIGQSHPLLATGKPALYLHGPGGAHASASWDSEIGIQFLAYIDPESAWGALEGLLSLVDATGRLAGEFLPAREAQTAWVLTCLTGDDKRLAAS